MLDILLPHVTDFRRLLAQQTEPPLLRDLQTLNIRTAYSIQQYRGIIIALTRNRCECESKQSSPCERSYTFTSKLKDLNILFDWPYVVLEVEQALLQVLRSKHLNVNQERLKELSDLRMQMHVVFDRLIESTSGYGEIVRGAEKDLDILEDLLDKVETLEPEYVRNFRAVRPILRSLLPLMGH